MHSDKKLLRTATHPRLAIALTVQLLTVKPFLTSKYEIPGTLEVRRINLVHSLTGLNAYFLILNSTNYP
jgi:hypothetical protein